MRRQPVRPPAAPVATLKDIARLAKVTPSVVSTVLSGRQGSIRFSAETAERVRAAAARLHYRPDRMAQSLRAKEYQAIGLLSTSLYMLPHMFLHWLTLALGRQDRLVIIQNLAGDDPDACQMLRQRFVDAAICGEVPGPAVLRRTAEIGLPLLFVNADPGVPAPRLLFDEQGGLQLAVEHLRQRGYDRIILHDYGGDGYWVEERRRGCRAACKAAGLPPPRVITCDGPASGRGEEADGLAAACAAGTGVVVQASSVLPFLLSRLSARGLRIPQDVGVVTLSPPPPMDLRWTFAEINTRILADTACELLLTPGGIAGDPCRRAPYELHPEASTARA